MDSIKGHLLIASSDLPDPNFAKTVVLIVEHDSKGALGIVLNRPSQYQLADIWEKVCDEECDGEEPLGLGGPITGPLMAIHTQMPLSDSQILPGVYFSTDKQNLLELVRENRPSYRIFSGYAGWAGGQLDGELARGDWLTAPATEELIFETGEDLWAKMLKSAGKHSLFSVLNIKHILDDPSLN
jgi:putative transcriptional regulator